MSGRVVGLRRPCRGRPPFVVAADPVRLPPALQRELDGQPLERDDVDGGMAGQDERRLAAQLFERGDRGDGALGRGSLGIAGGQIISINAIANPDKLAHLGPVGDLGSVLRSAR